MEKDTAQEEAIDRLAHPRLAVRLDAVAHLQRNPSPLAIEPLLHALDDPAPTLRAAAASALAAAGDAIAVPRLLAALHDEDATVRGDVAEALGQLRDERAFEPLVWMLQHEPDPVTIWQSTIGLSELQDRRSLSLMINWLAHFDVKVRRKAAFVLGRLGNTAAVLPLIQATQDVDGDTRCFAIESLGLLGDDAAVRHLRSLEQPEWKGKGELVPIFGTSYVARRTLRRLQQGQETR